MDREIVTGGYPPVKVISRYNSGSAVPTPKYSLSVVTTDMQRPCDRFKHHSVRVSALVDARNWIILGPEYWGALWIGE